MHMKKRSKKPAYGKKKVIFFMFIFSIFRKCQVSGLQTAYLFQNFAYHCISLSRQSCIANTTENYAW